MQLLPRNEPNDIIIGPFLDASDGVTPLTNLTITPSDVRIGDIVSGFVASTGVSNATHLENGYYMYGVSAGDTSDNGEIVVAVHMAGALPVWHRYMVVERPIYDALVYNLDGLRANVVEWNGAPVAAPGTAGYPVVTLKDGAGDGELADVADAVWDEAIAGHLTAGSTGEKLSDAGSGGDPLNNQVPGSYAAGTAGALLGRLSETTINITAPLLADGNLSIVAGDDYTAAINRAIDFVDSDNLWPSDITGATVTLRAEHRTDGTSLSKAGSVVTPTGTKKVRIELTDTDTANLTEGRDAYDFQVEIVLTTGEKITAAAGKIHVTRRITAA